MKPRQPAPETKPCVPPGITAERSGNDERAFTPTASLRRRCAASRHSASESPRATRPYDRRNSPHQRTHEPPLRFRHRRDRPRDLTPAGKGAITPQAGGQQECRLKLKGPSRCPFHDPPRCAPDPMPKG
jgi:hypothetical protein